MGERGKTGELGNWKHGELENRKLDTGRRLVAAESAVVSSGVGGRFGARRLRVGRGGGAIRLFCAAKVDAEKDERDPNEREADPLVNGRRLAEKERAAEELPGRRQVLEETERRELRASRRRDRTP